MVGTPMRDTRVGGRFWVDKGEHGFLGARRIELLEAIAERGSISQAAKAMKMSYKAAWEAVDAMNNLADEPLVVRITGGRNGGGTQLTSQGQRTIEAYRVIEAEYARFITRLSEGVGDLEHFYELMRRFALKTSVRNQLRGRITAIQRGSINSEVRLLLSDGDPLTAILTNEGVESLGLEVGREVYALIQESSVIMLARSCGVKVSARNRLCGIVHRCQKGAVNAEVALELDGGHLLTSVITNDSITHLGLCEGQHACVTFKASDVILAVND